MYISSDIANRIKDIAKNRNVSVRQMLIDVGLGSNTLSNFKTSFPKADNLAKIADYLDCSVDYLLGRAAEKSPPILQDGDETLLTQYHKLDEGDRGFIRGEIAVLLTAEKYQQDAGPAAI